MNLDCRGCAGCCLDWRPLVPPAERDRLDHERRGPYPPLDDTYNLVPLDRDEIRGFLEEGLGDVLTPRLWKAAPEDPHVRVAGQRLAAIDGRPAFFVGLRKPPKPVAPFDRDEPVWLPTCVFLDPRTLQCRIYDDERYPTECADYPAHNLALGQRSECERVEAAWGGPRLLDDSVPSGVAERLRFGPQAIGSTVFCHPTPADIDGIVDRLVADELTATDRAEFVAVAAASSPGTVAISGAHYEAARTAALESSSWAGEAIDEWERLASTVDPRPERAAAVEDEWGAPRTPGWDD